MRIALELRERDIALLNAVVAEDSTGPVKPVKEGQRMHSKRGLDADALGTSRF